MAITPWSWTQSNGTATTAQTQAAYTAITNGGMTSAFSRKVWNDLVDIISEVATALGHGWSNAYLTKYNTGMHSYLSPLSAAMFNSARYNTGYQSWTWEYDPTANGYIGRTDFQGVSDVGETASDFVYGAYFIELTRRLNTVIGIINGTGNLTPMQETVGLFLQTASEMILAMPQGMQAGEIFTITQSGTLEQERQRSWILHFRLSMPTHRATLEIGNYAFAEANLWNTLQIKRDIRQSPSDALSVHFRFPQTFVANTLLVPSEPLSINYSDSVQWITNVSQLRSRRFSSAWYDDISGEGHLALAPYVTIIASDSHQMRHSATAVTEQMGLFAAQVILRNYYRATARADHSGVLDGIPLHYHLYTTQTMHTAFAPIMQKDLSYLLSIVSTAHVPQASIAEYIGNHILHIRKDANIAHSASAVSEIPMELATAQKLNRYHSKLFGHEQNERLQLFGEMLQQQMGFFLINHRIGYSMRTQLTKLGSFPLTIDHSDSIESSAAFSLEVMHPIIEHFIQPTAYNAFLQSEDLPSLYVACVNPVDWVTNFSFLEPYPLIANGIQRDTHIVTPVLLSPTAITAENTSTVNAEIIAEAKMLKNIGGSVLERFLTSGNAKIGYTHRFGGSVGGTIHITASEMSCARGALDLYAQADGLSGGYGTVIQILPQAFTAISESGHSYTADLGLIRYAYMRVDCRNELTYLSELETNGDWIYPAQTGKNLYVVQVYETDQFNETAFFDFGKFNGNEILISGVPVANIGYIYRCDADGSIGFGITPSAEMNFVNAAAWEYPVQNGSDLTVTQVGYMKLHQRKLEVQ